VGDFIGVRTAADRVAFIDLVSKDERTPDTPWTFLDDSHQTAIDDPQTVFGSLRATLQAQTKWDAVPQREHHAQCTDPLRCAGIRAGDAVLLVEIEDS
jgi:hypothetical protein